MLTAGTCQYFCVSHSNHLLRFINRGRYNELNSLKASDIAALRAQLGDNSAILEMLFLIKNLNMTYKEASELDVKERKMLVAAVAKYLGLESPRTEEK